MTYENFVQVQLAAPLGSSDTTLTLANPTGAYRLPPATGGILVLADSVGSPSFTEIISYVSRSGNTLSGLTRGQEGTSARAWPAGTFCYQSLTAGDFANALGLKAPLESPAFTGTPTAPTPAADDSDTSIATTAFVRDAMGLFGLGVVTLGADIPDPDAIASNGLYRSWNSAKMPSLSTWIILHVMREGAAGRAVQLAWEETSQAEWRRHRTSAGAWQPWYRVWDSKNLVKQSSPTDTTAGAVMAVGAFGVGGHLGLPDPNQPAAGGGFYGHDFNETSTTTTGYPRLGDGYPRYWNTIAFGLGTRKTEIASEIFGVATQQARTFIRVKHDANWSAWRELYTQASILGAVSQSGGVPTGAIIERGSNANGQFIKYADGTLICWQKTDGGGVNWFDWIYPAGFVSTPVFTATINPSGNSANIFVTQASASAASASIRKKFMPTAGGVWNDAFGESVDLLAIGRWY